ncbi:TetR/AcrR family transcriptional regulator [Sabulicella glaciei]|uniref:TetR/AcrR family transcriptional regulator n=1 Tax=Sabulicella glaciei TaxID=2984948 RepID=A0ABT3NTT7_9PROT|nr:helix-turn-helix domain-containing protein [Roseococcus sp. MDT2-1-1]MCW8085565.1 TetR/AcrR family transcriptional regulator [Roseococcus sp. MDT2-1-1]
MTRPRKIAAQVKDAELVSERHAHIAKAAVRVSRERGFHNATIRDVAIEAGLSQGSLYNYVRSKDDILYLVHQDLTSGYARDVEAAIAGLTEPRARLRTALPPSSVRCANAMATSH